eukprot:309194-Chlamydomonas_euryale.AAC.1
MHIHTHTTSAKAASKEYVAPPHLPNRHTCGTAGNPVGSAWQYMATHVPMSVAIRNGGCMATHVPMSVAICNGGCDVGRLRLVTTR